MQVSQALDNINSDHIEVFDRQRTDVNLKVKTGRSAVHVNFFTRRRRRVRWRLTQLKPKCVRKVFADGSWRVRGLDKMRFWVTLLLLASGKPRDMRISNFNKIRLRWRAARVVRPSHTMTL